MALYASSSTWGRRMFRRRLFRERTCRNDFRVISSQIRKMMSTGSRSNRGGSESSSTVACPPFRPGNCESGDDSTVLCIGNLGWSYVRSSSSQFRALLPVWPYVHPEITLPIPRNIQNFLVSEIRITQKVCPKRICVLVFTNIGPVDILVEDFLHAPVIEGAWRVQPGVVDPLPF